MEPNLNGTRRITVRATAIAKAIARGRKVSDDWQAGMLEIALLPNVAKRYAAVNGHLPGAHIVRHKGLPHVGMTSDDNRAVTDWSVYAGYVLDYGGDRFSWNGVSKGRKGGYSHGPSRTWDGVRRETYHSFLLSLRYAYIAVRDGKPVGWRIEDNLRKYRIRFVDDLEASL